MECGMTEREEVINFAKGILYSYFCDSQVEYLISTFDDNIIWLGGGIMQKAEGKEAVAKWFRDGQDELTPSIMQNEEYEYMKLSDDCYLCEGRSDCCLKSDEKVRVSFHQRITFVFRRINGELKTIHIHNSLPYGGLRDDELFIKEYSDDQYEILKNAYDRQSQQIIDANVAIKNQAKILNQLYQTVPYGVIQLKQEYPYDILMTNDQAADIYGIDRNAVGEQKFYELLHEKVIESVDKLDELTSRGSVLRYERLIKKLSGQETWISVHLEATTNGLGLDVIQAVIVDITEARLRQAEREHEKLLENKMMSSALLNSNHLIMKANLTRNNYSRIAAKMDYVGSLEEKGTYDELILDSLKFVHPDYREEYERKFSRENILRAFELKQDEIYMELMQLGDDKNYHWISCTFIHVGDETTDDMMAISLVKILDEQRAEKLRQEQILRDALNAANAANAAKSDFLSRMSHDIRTPLNAIIGMSALGRLKLNDRESVLNSFEKIDRSSKYLLTLINDILDMSKIESGKIVFDSSRFDFIELLEDVSQIVYGQARAKNINYEIYHEEPISRYYIGDALRIKQIILNLLSNSLKFTPDGGRISVNIKEISRSGKSVEMEMIVSDTGCGMSSEFLDKLFLPFEQENTSIARNNVGSGLGLAIVKNLVELMGGHIIVTSEIDKGTEFRLTFHFGAIECDEINEGKCDLLKGMRVLIADDDEAVGVRTTKIMEDIGAESLWVDSGVKAVEAVKKSLEEHKIYDVAFIDWQMPGMDGIETAVRIRQLVGKDTTIIIITAYDWSVIEREARNAGVDYFVSKPIFRSTIQDSLLKLMEEKHSDADDEPVKLSGKRILLVEDNLMNQEISKAILEMYGMIVSVAENGYEAVKAVEYNPENFDAILMDIRMPVMDGITATREIRSLHIPNALSIPIIAMSANAFDEDRRKALSAGMNDYLVKPIEIKAVMEKLCEYI